MRVPFQRSDRRCIVEISPKHSKDSGEGIPSGSDAKAENNGVKVGQCMRRAAETVVLRRREETVKKELESTQDELQAARRELSAAKGVIQAQAGELQVARRGIQTQASELQSAMEALRAAHSELRTLRAESKLREVLERQCKELRGHNLEKASVNRLHELREILCSSADRVTKELASRGPSALATRSRLPGGIWQWQSSDNTYEEYEPWVCVQLDEQLTRNRDDQRGGDELQPLPDVEVANGGVRILIHLASLEQEVVGGSGRRRPIRRVPFSTPTAGDTQEGVISRENTLERGVRDRKLSGLSLSNYFLGGAAGAPTFSNRSVSGLTIGTPRSRTYSASTTNGPVQNVTL